MRTVYFATDHAGFELKELLRVFVSDELGYTVVDCGAKTFTPDDDYVEFVKAAATAVAADPENRCAIILGGSGQGEAMAANRFSGVRAAVYYGQSENKQTDTAGEELDIVRSTRVHNNANVLALGARFISNIDAKQAVATWLATDFSNDKRHQRRNNALDQLN